jgi:hypothetical protein
MTLRHRLTLVLPLALLMAGAVARAELGADTEASALFTPAFLRALPVAAALGWLVAPGFGAPGVAGWLRAAGLSLLVLAGAGLAATLILPVLRHEGGPFALLLAVPDHPLAWGSALFACGAAQIMALRQRRPRRFEDGPGGGDQSRK